MAKVFVTRSDFPSNAIKLLQTKCEVVSYDQPRPCPRKNFLEGVKGVDAIFCISTDIVDSDILNAAGKQLKVVSTMSVGFDHIDVGECKKRNVLVTNVPHLSTDSVAEFALGLLLGVGRRIVEASSAIAKGKWTEKWSPTWYCGKGLKNATVGIVGMGRIGQGILKRVIPFNVKKVLYYDVIHPVEQAENLGAVYSSFEDLLKESDFVIASCILCDGTREIFNATAFDLMKSTAVFINVSRGGVVQQDDLYNALKNGTIRAAGLDVMVPEPLPKDHKLVSLPNIVLSPHIGSSERDLIIEQAEFNARNIVEVLEGREPLAPV
ncbi:glyoxylate reductase/hydroxypyruvate reductase-like [Centruroides sculpturatus]|uniref:glyoxylate reductase/hydroxypyruvate reductase-like n=1 Tax=Centruroides sculpturatus TaxID=218467 RepID=UPI000C6DCFC0|nr:glyoxylate reductase/hydroxypyruvate reductase-like [Centruroides sculpturatus]XP_023235581.1 glyoxylate reductase/hydroxypyruvate reductase-like [Centruroides sculpturatus]XP_023235582.1 glyoxylate reductase/hydroxypyruvate reductase-like [Centruroides sculpturatus]